MTRVLTALALLVSACTSGGGGGFCVDSEDGAPCCDPPATIDCPFGTTYVETFWDDGALSGMFCDDANGDHIGPFVSMRSDGGGANYGDWLGDISHCVDHDPYVRAVSSVDANGDDCSIGCWDAKTGAAADCGARGPLCPTN